MKKKIKRLRLYISEKNNFKQNMNRASKDKDNRNISPKANSPKTNGRNSPQKRKPKITTRRNLRLTQVTNRRNRLQRAQYASASRYRNNVTQPKRNNRSNNSVRFGFVQRRSYSFRPRRTNYWRKLYVGGLPRTLDNRGLYNLFKNEGRLIGCQIMYDRLGNSRGFGNIEFKNPIDALRTIRRWNNTKFMGLTLRVEYQKNRNINKGSTNRRRNFNNNYRNYQNSNGNPRRNYQPAYERNGASRWIKNLNYYYY